MAFGTQYAKTAQQALEQEGKLMDQGEQAEGTAPPRGTPPAAPAAAPTPAPRVARAFTAPPPVAPPAPAPAPSPTVTPSSGASTPSAPVASPASRGRFQPMAPAPLSAAPSVPPASEAPAGRGGRFTPVAVPAAVPASSNRSTGSAVPPSPAPAPVAPSPAAVSVSAPVPSAPVPAPAASPAPARRFEAEGMGVAPPRDDDTTDPLGRGQRASGEGYGSLDRSRTSRRPDGLPLELEYYIDRIAERRGLPIEQVEEFKRQASQDVPNQLKRFKALYESEIQPAVASQYHTLEQAVQEHPDDVVYLVLKGSKRSLKIVPKDMAGSSRMFHGSLIEVVRASATPFRSPKEVYGPAPTTAPQPAAPPAVDSAPTPVARAPRL